MSIDGNEASNQVADLVKECESNNYSEFSEILDNVATSTACSPPTQNISSLTLTVSPSGKKTVSRIMSSFSMGTLPKLETNFHMPRPQDLYSNDRTDYFILYTCTQGNNYNSSHIIASSPGSPSPFLTFSHTLILYAKRRGRAWRRG